MTFVHQILGLEVLDSRGYPTVQAEIRLAGGVTAKAKVPSGASTGVHEAVELRDGGPRFGGKGTRRAVRNIVERISPALAGMDAVDQAALDARMLELDGTPDKSRLGANAILAVSCAAARAAAMAKRMPLWQWLAASRAASVPLPMVNILSGGLHAGHNIEFQDFLIVPHGFESYGEALEAVVRVHGAARDAITEAGYALTGTADEGGWGPLLESNTRALELLTAAIERAGYRPGEQISIALDVAASHFFRDFRYELKSEHREFATSGMIALLEDWVARFPVISIEDGLAEDEWEGWRELTAALGSRIQLVGDDLFCTHPARLERGIASGVANAVLVKMNQIGTLTETLAVVDRARAAGYRAVISARSGETEDDFLADLAVASGSGQIKVGSVRGSERLAKYNRLLEIERSSGLEFARGAIFAPPAH